MRRRPRISRRFFTLALMCVIVAGIGVTGRLVEMVGLLSVGAAAYLDGTWVLRNRLTTSRWSRFALWLLIPAAGVVLELGVAGRSARPFGGAILVGPVFDRLRAGGSFLFYSPRARRVIASVERAIGFNDVPKEQPKLPPAAAQRAHRSGHEEAASS